jgi:hypothetical protein
VLQVPFFPPVENLSDYDNKRCLEIVKKSIFPDKDPRANSSKIEIKSVNSWKMEAVVAESFINKVKPQSLCFPCRGRRPCVPSEWGFGMNTGIGDAYNLAHKLSWALNSNSDKTETDQQLRNYDTERRFIGKMTKDLAMVNY